MKVTRPGEIPPLPVPDEWVGITLTCKCGCQLQLEEDDAHNTGLLINKPAVVYVVEKTPPFSRYIIITCPVCGFTGNQHLTPSL